MLACGDNACHGVRYCYVFGLALAGQFKQPLVAFFFSPLLPPARAAWSFPAMVPAMVACLPCLDSGRRRGRKLNADSVELDSDHCLLVAHQAAEEISHNFQQAVLLLQ